MSKVILSMVAVCFICVGCGGDTGTSKGSSSTTKVTTEIKKTTEVKKGDK